MWEYERPAKLPRAEEASTESEILQNGVFTTVHAPYSSQFGANPASAEIKQEYLHSGNTSENAAGGAYSPAIGEPCFDVMVCVSCSVSYRICMSRRKGMM